MGEQEARYRGHAPPQRARKSRSTAQHEMAVGRQRAYAPRTAHTRAICERVRAILAELVPFDLKPTVRHLFYRLVEALLVEKTEAAYERWQEQSVSMRKGGYIALDSMIDSSREFLTWRVYTRPSDALLDAAYSYARDPWLDQEEAVCLVCEAETHKESMPPEACRVVRAMVTEEQIRRHDPPLLTRPPKPGDTRTPWYEREFPGLGCVELDAFLPQEVIAAVRAAVEALITDRAAWERNEEYQRAVRVDLVTLIEANRARFDRPMGDHSGQEA